ncbi:MAG: thioredoxin domain-containing protein [Candidatus Kerfeldbacteria bacterium]
MENGKQTPGSGKSFLQDPQKLTLAFGLSAGIAVMAIVALVIVAVNGTGGTKTSKNTNTAAVTNTNTDTSAADAALYDPIRIASTISGLDQNKFADCYDAKKYTSKIDGIIQSATTAGVQGTPTSYINGTEVSGAVPYAQLKSAIDAAISGTKGSVNVPAVTKDDHVEGASKPKVYLIEYSDFQCPYCKAFNATVQQALSDYNNLAVVFRHFPLESIHLYARGLAEGSECAAEQDKFWEYHDTVFSS